MARRARRIRRGKFRWGEGFVAEKPPFAGPSLKALMDHCYDLIEETPHAPELVAAGVTPRRPFEWRRHGLVLRYDCEADEWVLDIVTRPKKRPRTR